MATTTPNYGWAVPTSTDLVKDGATAIETLGDAIDASLVDLRGGTTGQVLKKASATQMDFEWGTASSGLTLISTTSFSGVSSQSLTPVFSTTYTNYRLMLILTSTATDGSVYFKLRSGATDESGAAYSYSRIQTSNNGAPANASATNATLGWEILDIDSATSGSKYVLQMDLFSPFDTVNTNAHWTYKGFNTAAQPLFGVSGSNLNTTTSYDGCTIIGPGNLAGTVSVYGYAK